MRFRFCGDLDCPDWVLAEINTLSKISSVKMKLLCVQVIKDLLGDQIDYEKVNKLTADAKFEHTGGLCKSYEDTLERLRTHFRERSLRLSRLESVEWRVDYILSSSQLQEVNEPCVNLKLKIKDTNTDTTNPVSFTMTADKFALFLSELKQASNMMDSLSTDS